MNLTVLVPAAGAGRRMQAGINKQYLALDNRPILAHTLELFDRSPEVRSIWVIVPEAEIEYCREDVTKRFGFKKIEGIVAGGRERQDSVRNGLRACQLEDEAIVLIHDGARPFFDPAMINSVAQQAAETGACVVGVPVKETIKQVAAGRIISTPERNTLWLAQTPQAFRYRLIMQAHDQAVADGYLGTDDASLLERTGHPVAMIAGDYRNIKITTPEDLAIARALLQWRREQQ